MRKQTCGRMRNASGLKSPADPLAKKDNTLSGRRQSAGKSQEPGPKKLREQVRDAIRLKHYFLRADLRELRSQDQVLHPDQATEASQPEVESSRS